MPAARQPAPLVDRLRRIVAAGSAALVLALTILAVSPVAHDWLHGKDGDHVDHRASADTCAVVIFASGVAPDLGQLAPVAPAAVTRAVSLAPAADVLLVLPRFLRQPERGPPLGLDN